MLFLFFLTFLISQFSVLTSPQAAEFSGKYLLHVCSSDNSGKEIVSRGHTACQAYIAAVIDYHNFLKSLKTAPGVDFCLPEDIALSKLQKILVVYLLKNNQHDDFVAAPAVALAFHQAYPCGKRKK